MTVVEILTRFTYILDQSDYHLFGCSMTVARSLCKTHEKSSSYELAKASVLSSSFSCILPWVIIIVSSSMALLFLLNSSLAQS